MKCSTLTKNTRRLLHSWAAVIICTVIGVLPMAVQAYTHPGMMHTAADFTRMTTQVNANAQPWLGGWNKLVANPHSSSSYVMKGPVATLVRGTPSNGAPENYMTADEDAAAAYQNALRWKIKGDTACGNKAVSILNAWARTCTKIDGDSNRALVAGLQGVQFANAAEIMRSYSGWASADFNAFKTWMANVWYPVCSDELSTVAPNGWKKGGGSAYCPTLYEASWDLLCMNTVIAIGILNDDSGKVNEAINFYKNGPGNGCIGTIVWRVYSGGIAQSQEAGRDQGHNTMEPILLGQFCQMALNVGIDMFNYNPWTETNPRPLAMSEYACEYNLGNSVPYTSYTNSCTGTIQSTISSNGRGTSRPGWDLLYNYYVNVKGKTATYTAQMATQQRPDGGGGDYGTTSGSYDQLGFTTLTCSLVAGGGGGPIANGTYSLKNVTSGKMLDNLGVATNGATVAQWTDGTSNNQKWVVTLISGSSYSLQCVTGSLMLDSLGHTANGSTVGQWANSGSNNQRWTVTASGSHYKLINVANGLCLDNAGSTADGATMLMYGSGTSNNQLWDFVAP